MAEYVEERNGGYYVAGTRISLDSIIYEFRRGAAPESIFRAFPLIGSLERVYGAIAYHLAHKQDVELYLERQEKLWEEQRSKQTLPAELKDRLERVRQESAARRR